MKIGQFARRYSVSVDTVRYYMDYGLLTPLKDGGHYAFGSGAAADMDLIMDLKACDFSLADIKKVLLYRKLSPLVAEDSFREEVYRSKDRQLSLEIERLKKVRRILAERISTAEGTDVQVLSMGLPLEALQLFACPFCNEALSLNANEICANQVMWGRLSCGCGYELQIENGMVLAPEADLTAPSLSQSDVLDYIEATSTAYFNEIHRSVQWLADQFNRERKRRRVILDAGTGHGLIARRLYGSLHKDSILICNDLAAEKLSFMKGILEKSGIRRNVVFLAGDLRSLPLKRESIDVLTMVLTAVHLLKYGTVAMDALAGFMKRDSSLYLTHMVYDAVDPENSLACSNRRELSRGFIEDLYRRHGYLKINGISGKELPAGGPYESFTYPKDRSYLYSMVLKRMDGVEVTT